MNLSEIENGLKALADQWDKTSPDDRKAKLDDIRNKIRGARQKLNRLEDDYRLFVRAKGEEKALHAVRQMERERLSETADRLRRTGIAAVKHPALREAMEKLSLRLAELVRAGRREEAFHLLLRVYLANSQSMPAALAQAFSPKYSVEEFRLLLFSYLSGIASKWEN